MKIQASHILQPQNVNFGKKKLSVQLPDSLRVKSQTGLKKSSLFALLACFLFIAGGIAWNSYYSPKAKLNRMLREVEEMIKDNSNDTLNNNQSAETVSIDKFI